MVLFYYIKEYKWVKMIGYVIIISIFISMRTHRGKQFDWSKPFKLVDSKMVFDELENNENELVINITAKVEPQKTAIQKKQEIIVPKIQTVPRITQVKKFAKVEPNYHRITAQLNLPKLMNYELTQVDHMFLQGHGHRFKYNDKTILNEEFLSKTFVEMELKAGKDPVLPKTKAWMTQYLDREHPQLSSYAQKDQLADTLYNYWKNRRQQLKFPLLRSLWRPNPDQYNHLLAFKPREKEKRNLRRTNRLPEDEIAQQLEEQFSLAMKIVDRIKLREQTKEKQVHHQISSFHSEYKQYFGTPDFIPEFNYETRNKDKEKLKKFGLQVQQIKKQQIEEEKQNQLEANQNQSYDQKLSIVEFLSTVIYHAETLGVSYDKIFNQKSSRQPAGQTVNNSYESLKEPVASHHSQPLEEPAQHHPAEKGQTHNLHLLKHQGTIYRTLESTTSELEEPIYSKKPKNYFDYKREEIRSYYFGDDDDGDFKDLKRNIQQSFKKYLQFNRNFTGEGNG